MKALLLVLSAVAFATLLLLIGGLAANRPLLGLAPGPWKRLSTYLSTNVAETAVQAPFPELEMRHYRLGTQQLYGSVQRAMALLGWEIADADGERLTIHAEVTSRLWRFKDDVTVRVSSRRAGESALWVRSASRVGRGDLGANTRHIIDLYTKLEHMPDIVAIGSGEPADAAGSPPSAR